MKKGCKGAVGMPLGIQIIGRRYQEELILALMDELEKVTEFSKNWLIYYWSWINSNSSKSFIFSHKDIFLTKEGGHISINLKDTNYFLSSCLLNIEKGDFKFGRVCNPNSNSTLPQMLTKNATEASKSFSMIKNLLKGDLQPILFVITYIQIVNQLFDLRNKFFWFH